jgi:hypothetical protein
MYDIGQQWAEGKLDVATEHVCVNTANALIKIIDKSQLIRSTNRHYKGTIFIRHQMENNIIYLAIL